MKVIIFGATGMIGQGALRECLADETIESILSIGRSSTESRSIKLREEILPDLSDLSSIESKLKGFDACFFCLGTASPGKTEEEYSRVTYDLTVNVAETLAKLNPGMTFIYVSAQGSDRSEKGPIMWARVRGRLENKLLTMPFKGVYSFRPGIVQPQDGIHSRVKSYRMMYNILKPVLPGLRRAFPGAISSTRLIGQAMISVAENGYESQILSTPDFRKAAKSRL